MGDDLEQRLIDEADARDYLPLDHDADVTADMRKAAADLARLRAENEALKKERDAATGMREGVAYRVKDAWGGYWQTVCEGKPYTFRLNNEALAALAAAEAKAARLEKALGLLDAPLTYDWNGHVGMEVDRPDLSDTAVACRVRMLTRKQLDHEFICELARSRIMGLSKRLAEVRAAMEAK